MLKRTYLGSDIAKLAMAAVVLVAIAVQGSSSWSALASSARSVASVSYQLADDVIHRLHRVGFYVLIKTQPDPSYDPTCREC